MFCRIQQAPPAEAAGLRCLSVSLNTPVVAIDQLLVGPAEACIAVYGRPGALGLVLALRSVRSGQLAFFAPDPPETLHNPDLAIETAAGFAEAMGFLFDEEPLDDRDDPRGVARRWREFLAEPELPEAEALETPLVLSKFRFNRRASAGAARPAAARPRRFVRG